MDNFIQEILNDLFMLDPELKKHEKELAELAKTLLSARPETKFSEQFAVELKSELMKRAQALKPDSAGESDKSGLLHSLFMNKFAYAAAGALLMLIVILPFLSSEPGIKPSKDSEKVAVNFNEGITELKENAFGALSADSQGMDTPAGLGGGGVVRTESGGGGTLAAPQAESTASWDKTESMAVPRPDMVNYEYVYTGDDINISEDRMAVYKRVKSAAGGQTLAQTITGFAFDLLDLSQFKDTEITNLNLNENRDFGYSLYLNLSENSLDINQNWQKWPHPENLCRDEACYDRYRVKIEEVPTDDKILSIAREFIGDYNIDVSGFGEPFVQNQWRQQYDRAENKALAYIPDEMSVVYPYVIEGEMVYNQGGHPAGIYLGVNIRHSRVSGLHSLRPRAYESSEYEIINGSDEIIELAEQGGLWPRYQHENADKTVTVELGAPQLGLLQNWKYISEDGTSQELYIPALIFPVKNLPELESEYYQENIVVPLIKDMLEEMRPPIGIPEPMPLLREEVNSAEVQDEAIEEIDDEGEVKGESEVMEPKEIMTQIRIERD